MSIYKRGKTYWIKFESQGQLVRQSARTTSRSVALAYERKLRAEFANQYRGATGRVTYVAAMERFITEHLTTLKHKTQKRYIVSARQLHSYFKDCHLDEINRAKIVEYQTARRSHGANAATINRDISCLSSMLSCAESWEYIENNPLLNMRRKNMRENPPRTRFLTKQEYNKLLAELNGTLRAMVIVSVETGMRQEELLSLEWTQVNIKRREITLTKTKTDSPRIIPLSQMAQAQIQAQPYHIKSPYVFNTPAGDRYHQPYNGFRAACKRAGIKNLTWHDLRRTCGSWMIQDGVDMHIVKTLLGHKTVAVTERHYAFLRTQDVRDAIETRQELPDTKSDTGRTVYKKKGAAIK